MRHKRVLLIGTGGGNDIFSTMLAAMSLWDKGWRWEECSIAGVLSPFHRYRNIDLVADGFNLITPNSERWLRRKDYEKKIGFVDAAVSQMINEEPALNIKQIFGLSLAKGSVGLAESLRLLAKDFDYFVLVDIGGDILYRGRKDYRVLSPMFDLPGCLFEAGPGTDGELEPEAIESALAAAGSQRYDLSPVIIDSWEEMYGRWVAGIREGRTVPMTIEAFRSDEPIIVREYRARAHLGNLRLYSKFEHRIKTNLCRHFFLLEPQKINNPFAVASDSPFDWFVKTQVLQHRTNCEANLEYWTMGDKLFQFLTPSPLFRSAEKLMMLRLGLNDLGRSCDGAWLFVDDWNLVNNEFPGLEITQDIGLLKITPD